MEQRKQSTQFGIDVENFPPRENGKTLLTENFPIADKGETRDIVAQKLGIGSGKQYEKEKFIADNANPTLLSQWDKGDISTHAAYGLIKKHINSTQTSII